jgi:dTDP-4-amino-4,6-dideoxygalactose transaminase
MKLVSNQLGPNFNLGDALYAFGCALMPTLGKTDFSPSFETENYKLASTARTLLSLLADIIPEGKKVGIPGVCCAVMATPFLSKGKKICWLDTNETGLLDPKEVEKHKNELGLLLVPHIFGQRADISKIIEITKANNIIVVEDCAHSFEPGEPISDYRLLSFGREKDVSCVSGGALIWKKNAPGAEQVKNTCLDTPSRIWTFRLAIQPLILALSLPWWSNGGRFIAGVFSKIKVLPRAVTKGEKIGINDFPQTKLARTQQKILARAFRQRNAELSHRESLANMWKRKVSELFPESKITIPENSFRVLITEIERETVLKTAKQNGFDLNEWDGEPIAPPGVDLQKFGYQKGQCPNAEHFIKNYITFPTNRRTELADVEKFVKLWQQ